MTDDDKALVERLLDFLHSDDVFAVDWKDIAAAAEGIEALSAENEQWKVDYNEAALENERLREALKDALSHCYNCSGDPHYIEEDEATGDHLWTDCPICRSARAALGDAE